MRRLDLSLPQPRSCSSPSSSSSSCSSSSLSSSPTSTSSSCSASTPTPTRYEQLVSRTGFNPFKSGKKVHSYCGFCKRNGEDMAVYLSHVTKDRRGNVQCPVLFHYVCENCGATGPIAHTRRYCPNNKECIRRLQHLNVIWEKLRQGYNHTDLVMNKSACQTGDERDTDDGAEDDDSEHGSAPDFLGYFDKAFVESFVTDRDNFNSNVARLLEQFQQQ